MSELDPTQESLRTWTAVAPAWDAYRQKVFDDTRPASERLVAELDPQPGQTILELTCGTGETGFLVAEKVGADGTLIASDFVPAMVDATRRGAGERGLDNVDCRVIDAQQVDLPDDSVDGVLSRFGLMLVPDQEQAMREIRRVRRPGGRCAYATWAPPDRNPWLFQVVGALLQNGHAPPVDPFAPGGVFSLATSERNRELVTEAGFTSVDVVEVDGAMRFSSPDDYWTQSTSLTGPLATLVAGLGDEDVAAVRATLDASLAPFEHEGGLVLPWVSLVTSMT